jgi:coenzyme F420 hydrogenase subunit beta
MYRALRAIEEELKRELGLEQLYVIGTPCTDNTTTEQFQEFLALLGEDQGEDQDGVTYLEFRANYHVEMRYKDGRVKAIPFWQLPLSKLPNDFFLLTSFRRMCGNWSNPMVLMRKKTQNKTT